MTIKTVNTQVVSATGAVFLVDEISAGGAATTQIPYTKLIDGTAGGDTPVKAKSDGRLKVNNQQTGTALVTVHNQIDASVHGQVSAFITNTVRVDISATANVHVSNQIDASVHGQVSAFITNQVDVSAHGFVSAHVTNQVDVSAHGFVSAHITNTPTVIARQATDVIYDGTTALTPKFAKIGVNTAGAEIIIAAVAAKRIRVLNLVIVTEGAAGVYFTDGGGGNNLIGDATNPMKFGANGGVALQYSPVGWCQTSASSAFTIVPDTATSIAGTVTYIEV